MGFANLASGKHALQTMHCTRNCSLLFFYMHVSYLVTKRGVRSGNDFHQEWNRTGRSRCCGDASPGTSPETPAAPPTLHRRSFDATSVTGLMLGWTYGYSVTIVDPIATRPTGSLA